MANLTRWDPFRTESFEDAIDNLFKGFMVRPMGFSTDLQAPQIKMDVKEDEKTFTVHAEIPGVNKEDIQITIEGNRVAVSAEVKKESEEKKGETVLRSERYYGKVYRAFSLSQPVDEQGASAKYDNGVLELTLPKKAATAAKRLEVK